METPCGEGSGWRTTDAAFVQVDGAAGAGEDEAHVDGAVQEVGQRRGGVRAAVEDAQLRVWPHRLGELPAQLLPLFLQAHQRACRPGHSESGHRLAPDRGAVG